MQDLRNAIVSASQSTGNRGVSVQLGTRYPTRAVARNPAPPSGSLRTVGTTDESVALEIANAQASGETGDFWNESQSYNTGAIAYQPQYNVYTNPPATVYENTILYNSFRTGNVTVANQSFIDGNEISLVVINGSLSRSSAGTTSVNAQPVSSSTQTVQLEDDDSNTDPLNITFSSTRSDDYWDFLVDTQSTVQLVDSTDPTDGFYEVTVGLEPDERYELQMTRVGIGTRVTDENTSYLTDAGENGQTLSQGERTELTLEVRDRFNNPPDNASATAVEAEVADGGSLDSTSQTPNEDGEVTFEYTAPTGATDEQDIQFSYVGIDADYDASTPQNATITIDVQSSAGGGSGGGGSGDNAYSVLWQEPAGQIDCSGSVCTLDGSNSRSVDLTMETSPIAQQASTDYAVNNTTVGSLSPSEGQTDSDGENTTTLELDNEGTVDVYTYTGGSGDVIPIRVTDLDIATIAFIDDDNDDLLTTIDSDGNVNTHTQGSEDVRRISQIQDIDEDGNDEIAYVNADRDLRYVDTSTDDRTTVVDSADTRVQYSDASVSVGDGVGGSESELYYVDYDTGELYRAFLNGTTERVEYVNGGGGCPSGSNNGNAVTDSYGVLDVTDFDADGEADVVYVTSEQEIAYIETENCQRNVVSGSYQVGENKAPAGGEVISYNGELVMPIVDSTGDFTVISANGTVETLDSSYGDAVIAPLAPRDWDGDDDIELGHLNGNDGRDLYYAGVQDTELTEIENEDGETERGRAGGGVR